jgi:hypothetical protein
VLRARAIVAVVAAACSGPVIRFEDLAQELQRARCEQRARCGLFPDAAACARYARVVPDPSLAAAIAAHKVAYDGERASQCVDALARQGCDLTTRDAHSGPAACAEMFAGTLAGGDACSIDAACVSGTCDLPALCPPTGCCVGSCRAAARPARAGGPCARPHDCIDGLVCARDGTCRTPAGAGEACGSDRECGDGLGCIGALSATPGTCRPLPHAGEPCPYLRCADLNLRCDDSARCVPVGLVGDPCPTATECSPDLRCDPATLTCREYPTLGMPCTGVCGGDSFCRLETDDAGTCVALLANTAPCDGYLQCASFYCEQGPLFDSCKDPYVCF